MSDESQHQVARIDAGPSQSLSKVRTDLIARGIRDAASLRDPFETEADRHSLFDIVFADLHISPFRGEEIRKEAAQGAAREQYVLALLCEITRFVKGGFKYGDLPEAAIWYRRAADQGFAPAQFKLAWMYENDDLGVPAGLGHDLVEAAKWYRKAADQGFAPAQFNLGVMHDKGEGVPQSYLEAVKWYRRAGEQGLAVAQFNLGLKYDKGQGVERNCSAAAGWYQASAVQKCPNAEFSLGLKYANGLGARRDDIQAYLWVARAITHAGEDEKKRYSAIRDRIAENMNVVQTAEAERLASQST